MSGPDLPTLPRVGLRVVMLLALGVLACRPAHSTDGGAVSRPQGGGAHGAGERGDPGPHGDPVADGGSEVVAAEARIGPIRRAAPFVFVPHPRAATLARVAKALRSAAIGATPELRVELGCPGGARVVDRATAKKIPLGKDEARAAVIAGDGQWIAVELQADRVALFSRASAKRLGTWNGARPIALAPDVLVVRDQCRWLAIDPGAPTEAPRVLADQACGEPIHTDLAKRRIAIAETVADSASVAAIVHVGPDAEPSRLALPAGAVVTSVALSSDGEILCGVFTAEHEKSLLQCRNLAGGEFERVGQGVVGPLHFAADARRLAFTVAVTDDAMDLHIVDFAQRLIRRLGRVHHHRFAFLPGGERLVAYEGGRGIVYELDTGFLVPFGGREDDWVGILP
ncbi:MAG TPA: hypothetical protein VFG69_08475, partial [Nannocystaceae bacterium]|nr:hypothetical protein [Nannocystaceae bacterium]